MTIQDITATDIEHGQPIEFERTDGTYHLGIYRGVRGDRVLYAHLGSTLKLNVPVAEIATFTALHFN